MKTSCIEMDKGVNQNGKRNERKTDENQKKNRKDDFK